MPSAPTGAQGMLKHSPQIMDMNSTAEAVGHICLCTSALEEGRDPTLNDEAAVQGTG
jgi:hypothetical protein